MNRKLSLVVLVVLVGLIGGVGGAAGKIASPAPQHPTGLSTNPLNPHSPLSPLGTAFTYQGRLTQSGSPANGQYDINFTLFDALTGGNQVGSTVQVLNQTVTDGLFTVQLDFGSIAFQGEARWLELAVRQTGGGSFTTLSPRQPLTSAPYATSLRPGTVISGTTGSPMLTLSNSGGWGLYANSPSGFGVYGQSGTGTGVSGYGDSGYGVSAASATGTGLYASSGSGTGLFATTNSTNTNLSAVRASNTGSGPGVVGDASSGSGVYGTSGTGYGVHGLVGSAGAAVYGENTGTGAGVSGYSYSGSGTVGASQTGNGVFGSAASGYAGLFAGRVQVSGNMTVTGTLTKGAGSFKIDHPLDPAGKYLSHSFVESPDMMDIYNGNATLDANGEAWVELPGWFEALNKDFRYQLTAIGAPGPNLYVAEEVKGNRFKIAGGKPGSRVSWQVTGVRHDPYADAHRIPVEQDKPSDERGLYLHPELYGQPDSKLIGSAPGSQPGTCATPGGGK